MQPTKGAPIVLVSDEKAATLTCELLQKQCDWFFKPTVTVLRDAFTVYKALSEQEGGREVGETIVRG